ncbi:glycine--tRNA ligase, mitochondrial 1, partial [Carica papaya]|uniref:glycine--tRNA ligase, mitochondrial 1 n=1 Tax=Carica papaya TaxID=3649 RepID=UPI000B8CE014
EYGIAAPDTKNPLSDPYPFNLMFQTSIGPSGLSTGYMRPETAQGIFVNFKDLYYYNGNKLPFAAAQIGQAFRNEISPRQGLLRVREFTLAEIEHFVDPEDKSHPKYSEVANLEFLMFPREQQMSNQSAKRLCLGEAVSKGIVNNQTLGYFIGRVYLFLTRLGIDKERLRFRQHLANEMAHYAADCWDAEIDCSYGWIECVGIADRSAYDLSAHSEKSGVPLVAHEKFSDPREVEKLVIAPVKKELGLAFKGMQKSG